MSGKVISFPTQSVRNLRELEEILKKQLLSHTDDINLINHVTSKTLEYIKDNLNIDFNFAIPANLTDEQLAVLESSVDQISQQLHDMTSKIIFERVLLEIELYQSGIKF